MTENQIAQAFAQAKRLSKSQIAQAVAQEQQLSADKAKTELEAFDLTSIPLASLQRIGRIFQQGREKYGAGNWRNGAGDRAYQLERANHALKHLMVYVHRLQYDEYIGDEGDDDIAKAAWFCVTQMELERLEGARKE